MHPNMKTEPKKAHAHGYFFFQNILITQPAIIYRKALLRASDTPPRRPPIAHLLSVGDARAGHAIASTAVDAATRPVIGSRAIARWWSHSRATGRQLAHPRATPWYRASC
jgi:hypothetical protein